MICFFAFGKFPVNVFCIFLQDPHLRNLESRFALQQKIVEAAMKLANEGDLGKTVKKKRRNNCLDAMRKLEEIEKEINAYRIKKGKKPTQRASLILAGTQNLISTRHHKELQTNVCSGYALITDGPFVIKACHSDLAGLKLNGDIPGNEFISKC